MRARGVVRRHGWSSATACAGALGAILLLAGCGGGGPGAAQFQADGAACHLDVECTSGHCDSGLCCGKGTCCGTADDCPAAFRSDPTCTTPGDGTDCQGERRIAVCEQHVCGRSTLSDDSGCLGQVRACGMYQPVTCSAGTVQPVATCATRCDGPGECATGYTCVDHACAAIAGAGQGCTGTGQGSCSSAALKCQNGVCCDAAAGTCCTASSSCGNGLACDTATSTCFAGCTSGSTERCAAAGTYCASNACVAKLAPGATCTSTAQCASGSCECFDAACTQKKCRSSWCGLCQYATSDTACAPGLGSASPIPDPNPADACGGTASACYAGACKTLDGQACDANTQCGTGICRGGTCGPASALGGACDASDGAADCQSGLTCAGGVCKRPDGQACTADAECGSNVCECADALCASRVCHAGACGTCSFATSATACTPGLTGAVADPTPGECGGARACFAGVCKTAGGGTCSSPGECADGGCLGGICVLASSCITASTSTYCSAHCEDRGNGYPVYVGNSCCCW